MLPRADDNRKVNVSGKRRIKKHSERDNSKEKENICQEAQVHLVFNSGACGIRRGEIHCKGEGSRQMMREEV
jgi:hypothetical protein